MYLSKYSDFFQKIIIAIFICLSAKLTKCQFRNSNGPIITTSPRPGQSVWLNFLANSLNTTRSPNYGFNNRNRTLDLFSWTANRVVENIVRTVEEDVPATDMPVKFVIAGGKIPNLDVNIENVTINGFRRTKFVIYNLNLREFLADFSLHFPKIIVPTLFNIKWNIWNMIEIPAQINMDFELRNIFLVFENKTLHVRAEETEVQVWPVVTQDMIILASVAGGVAVIGGLYIFITGIWLVRKLFRKFCSKKKEEPDKEA